MSTRQNLAMTWWNRPGFEDYEGIICDGSIRSGKTVAMTVGFIMWAMSNFSGQNFALCGKTIESLRRNVTSNLSAWLCGVFTFKEHRTENKIVVRAGNKTNSFYLFGGKDESSQDLIQGITLAGILLDEVALMPESFVNQATGRCSVDGSKLWFNCNPAGPSHWFYTKWVQEAKKRKLLHLHFTMDDNLSLSPAVKARYESLYSGVFYDRFTNSFILDNYASQKNKGLHFGLDRLKGFLTDYWNKNHTADGWVLKCDVRHFFASIDHDRLKEKLKKLDLEPALYDLLCVYVDCSDGLPLGYQTSQLFALYYLDEFDHFVKEKLHIRYYGRYMDDFFLIHPDKEYLQYCLTEIQAFMASLGLELNEKTQIFPLRHGMDFLGFHTYLTDSGKVIRKLRHSSVKKMRAKLRRWEKEYPTGLVTREEILQSWQAWDAHAAHGNTWTLRQQVRDRVQNILKEEI